MQSTGTNRPPTEDEVEVSLFGPGFGECLVLYLGDGDWIVVDSCRDMGSKTPVALKYLEELGVDASRSVRRVIATHWHDDHIDGLGEVFRRSSSAAFACTSAFRAEEFKTLLLNYSGSALTVAGSGINEIEKIFIEVRQRQKAKKGPALRLCGANTIVWERFGQRPASVTALSPSPHDILAGVARIAGAQIVGPGLPRRRLSSLHPNDVSVALSVRVADVLILLGADLEETGNNLRGWRAVVSQWNPAAGLHQYFKIPHHGSANAHFLPVWSNMLIPAPDVTLTPFRHMLPTKADRDRIVGLAGRASLSAPPRTRRYRITSPAVQRVINGMTRNTWIYPSNFGHIRYRRRVAAGGSWTCELFGAAESPN